jgi:hypothetical protein
MTFLDLFQGTPYWVWMLFAYLLFIGIRATKKRTIFLFQASIMPIILSAWSIYSLQTNYGLSWQMLLWILFFSFSMTTAIMLYAIYQQPISIDKKSPPTITLPGSYVPLIISLVYFAVKYILGATYAINPLMRDNAVLMLIDIATSGIITGIAQGRFIHLSNEFNKHKK